MSDNDVNGKEFIAVVSFLLLIVSSAEIILGSLCFVFVLNVNVGAFWAGAWGFITACAGLAASSNKGIVLCAIILASICACVGVVGTVIDAAAAGFFTMLTTCVQGNNAVLSSLSNVNTYGSLAKNDVIAALACAEVPNTGYSASSCYCVYNGGCNGVSNTYCQSLVAPSNDYACYNPFRLNFPSQYNCGDMMSGPAVHYVQMLSGSAGLCGLITLFSFILAILGCCGICNERPSYDRPKESNNNEAVVTDTV